MSVKPATDLESIYFSRPFKTRNADEYDLENILDLFIDPTDGLVGPFEFTNSIIKGKMGSGKTMYLRANYAYYLYTLVPCLIENGPIILPVYIRLSDFQNIHEPSDIYNAIIIKIIEEIISVYQNHLKSADELARLHKGANTLSGLWSTNKEIERIFNKLSKMTADEYTESVGKSIELEGSASAKFFGAAAKYQEQFSGELKRRYIPKFDDLVDVCKSILEPFSGKLLLLFDEVGSTSRNFFRPDDNGDSYFKTLMNQLRTLSYVRTKIAVYPHSYSDILRETRYGDDIELECDIVNNSVQFNAFFTKTVSLIERYIEKATEIKCSAEDLFEISTENQILIEQLINASEGNMRRLVHLLDASMITAYSRNQGKDRISVDDVLNTLRDQGSKMESQYTDTDKEFLDNLAKVCRKRSTYRFTFPNKSTLIGRFTSTSEEYNIIHICQAGTGRQSSVYCFDYAYCVYKELPTHYIKESEKIDKSRSVVTGDPIKRIAQLTDELLFQSEIRGKIEGNIVYLSDEGGFIKDNEGKNYFFLKENIIKSDQNKSIRDNQMVSFLPFEWKTGSFMATEIEIL